MKSFIKKAWSSAKYHTTNTEYEIENVSEERKQLVLRKRLFPEYKLIDTPEPQRPQRTIMNSDGSLSENKIKLRLKRENNYRNIRMRNYPGL